MDTRASRCAIWKLHAPPSREADINPNPKKGGYPAPDRVTFLTGPNRDFPKWRRQMTGTPREWPASLGPAFTNRAPPHRVRQDALAARGTSCGTTLSDGD